MAAEYTTSSVKIIENLFKIQMEHQAQLVYPYFEMQGSSELSLLESKIQTLESRVSTENRHLIQGRNLGYYPKFDFSKFRQQLEVRESENLIIGNLEEERLKELQR